MIKLALLFLILAALSGRQSACRGETGLNHSGVVECFLDGPAPDPPARFLKVDSTTFIKL